MHRRKAVKAIALGAVTPELIFNRRKYSPENQTALSQKTSSFRSRWNEWPDMLWTGPEYWGNRLQDWQIKNGEAICVVRDVNRTLHAITCHLSARPQEFDTSVSIKFAEGGHPSETNYAGFLVGAKGKFDDYRSAAVFGEGMRVGISTEGKLFVGEKKSEKTVSLNGSLELGLHASPANAVYTVTLSIKRKGDDQVLDRIGISGISADALTGNIALLSHFPEGKEWREMASAAFTSWVINGAKVDVDPARTFGPICFAQYTLSRGILKLTAQLAPVEKIAGHKITFEVKDGSRWKSKSRGSIDPLGRSAHFRIEDWDASSDTPYRIRLQLPLKNGTVDYHYVGTIAAEPVTSEQVKMAVFSCNGDFGFPDADVHRHVSKHKPDLAVFLGDQFYERTGGFGIQTSPIEKSSLDYLRKWYMFGWSYREIFRNIPCGCIPDDHDVYHGNVWGEGGKHAPTDAGWGYDAQDQGGYKMPAEWVNMVQRTQTSHLPDPYDPTPVKQGIGVYYTSWVYAGVSMAILEDRKFKSAPKQSLPAEAKVVNGFIQNRDFDIRAHYDIDAVLLGDRQMKFLNDWITDWNKAEMKVVLSQTNFCAVATLPEGSILDNMVPQLPIPREGEYVEGDAPTSDMDSNGWPQKGRDEALRVIRKCFALHIAGDQHLGSMVQYGIDEFGDAGLAFAGPALNNIWPRRWWPPVQSNHRSLPGQPRYTGDFHDGFGNKMSVLAVANPRQTGRDPSIIYDRATGYGIVTFDKASRSVKVECWPRYADPEAGSDGQYPGWPVTIRQEDNYGRKAAGYLPTLLVRGAHDPVVQVIDESTGEIEYVLRIKGSTFRPKIFHTRSHTVRIVDSASGKQRTVSGLKPAPAGETLLVDL